MSGELINQQLERIAVLEREKNQLQMLSDANSKMVVKLQNERDGLIAQLKSIRIIFRSENLSQSETATALQKLSSLIDMLPEQCLSQIKAEAVREAADACNKYVGDFCLHSDLINHAASVAKEGL